jgi:hypothetical protein
MISNIDVASLSICFLCMHSKKMKVAENKIQPHIVFLTIPPKRNVEWVGFG